MSEPDTPPSPAEPKLKAFAALLTKHMRSGTRPHLSTSDVVATPQARWTNESLAAAIANGRGESVAANTISYWRNGRHLPPPEALSRILDAVFGAIYHQADRQKMHRAYEAARTEKLGGHWRVEGATLVPTTPSEAQDLLVARSPQQRAAQASLKAHAQDLQDPGLRLANSPIWRRLPAYARRLSEVVALEPEALVPQLGEAYSSLLALTACFTRDTEGISRDSVTGRFPLEPEARLPLEILIREGAPWLLGFPSIAARDRRYGRFLARTTEMPLTHEFFQRVGQEGIVAERTTEEFATLAEAAEVGGPTGVRAEGRAAEQAEGLVQAMIGIDRNPDLAPHLAGRVARVLREPSTRGLISLQSSHIDHSATAKQTAAVAEQNEARDLILRGVRPSPALAPHVRVLHFPEGCAIDLGLLRGLTALEILHLRNTQVNDINELEGMTSLHALALDSTQVSDLRPLASLRSLEWLYLSNTPIVDVRPLSRLTKLRWLDLRGSLVSDVSPLEKLASLRRLDLRGTAVKDAGQLKRRNTMLELYV